MIILTKALTYYERKFDYCPNDPISIPFHTKTLNFVKKTFVIRKRHFTLTKLLANIFNRNICKLSSFLSYWNCFLLVLYIFCSTRYIFRYCFLPMNTIRSLLRLRCNIYTDLLNFFYSKLGTLSLQLQCFDQT